MLFQTRLYFSMLLIAIVYHLGMLSSSEGSDEGPDEIIDLSDLSSDDQRVTQEDKSDDTRNKYEEQIEKEHRKGELETHSTETSISKEQKGKADEGQGAEMDKNAEAAVENEVLSSETPECEALKAEPSVIEVQDVEVDNSEAVSPDAAENEVSDAEIAEKEAQRGTTITTEESNVENKIEESLGNAVPERTVEIKNETKSGETNSSEREVLQDNSKSVEQKRVTSSLLGDSSEEEVVIRRMTVDRSEAIPSFVSEDANQTNSISSGSENIMNNVHHDNDDEDAKLQGSQEKRKEPDKVGNLLHIKCMDK